MKNYMDRALSIKMNNYGRDISESNYSNLTNLSGNPKIRVTRVA